MSAEQPSIERESRKEHVARLLAWCDERFRTHPEDVVSLLEITEALWDMGQRVEALDYSRRILNQHPGHAKAREMIQRFAAELPGGGRAKRGGHEEMT